MFRVRNLFVMLGLCAVTAVAFADLNSGIISAWTFDDGTAKDVVGNNDGILHGCASFSADRKGGLALDVDGVDGYVEVPHSPDFDVFADGFTVSAWMNVRQGRNHSAIVWKGEGIGWGPLFTFRLATTSDTNMTWGTTNETTEGWFATDNVYTTGEWTHIALTADGSVAVAYVNGDIPPSGQGNPKDIPGPYNVFPDEPIEMGVGRRIGGTDGNDFYLDGLIDDVIIYDRALSQDEILALMDFDLSTAVEAKGKLATKWGSLKSR